MHTKFSSCTITSLLQTCKVTLDLLSILSFKSLWLTAHKQCSNMTQRRVKVQFDFYESRCDTSRFDLKIMHKKFLITLCKLQI